MDKNINILELRIPNRLTRLNERRVLKKTDKQNCSCYCLNSSYPLKGSLSLRGIKSIKNINNNKKIINHNQDSNLSPKSKYVISYLSQYNNNSIFYSNHKKDKMVSKFGESKLNTEIKNIKNRIIFTSNKFTIKKSIIESQKSQTRIYNKKLVEDSKNNDSMEVKNNKYISSYIFFPKNNNGTSNNKQYIQTCKKSDNAKKKLLNIISQRNLFNEEKKESKISTPRNIIKMEIVNKRKNNGTYNPEKINIGEFIKLKKIGEGSFGKIFKVKWIQNNKNYAMKEMHFQSEDNILYLQKKLKLIMDFEKQTKCDGLIKIYGYSCSKKNIEFYFHEIMELASGDWEQEINKRKHLKKYYSEKEIFSILKQLVKTLFTLQQNHITHRDIKLKNILLVNDKYKICDFGESRTLTQKGTILQPVRGSELFMSPILFSGLKQKLMHVIHNTYKSDMFSLGMCILFAATLGFDSLYEIREMENMNDIRNVLNKYLSQRYSKNFIEILLCMLEFKEKKRPDFVQMEKVINLYENVNKVNI